ncbi:G-protein coupled receptor Mth isoform X2 [Solenopsis invicta]|uniref:G-protein coupled receptor Mth isoform X2 n=1 Tax=Solenopsis invicta TaxID=13686 RepID=UPI000595D9FE|nr:G-protein coupled receptor Mth isoform X2 [Solenopsis invicta]
MYIPSKILWCFVLLLVASYLVSHENSTKILTNCNIKQSHNSTVQRLIELVIDNYKLKNPNDEINSTLLNLPENFINNEILYEPCINSTKNETKNENSEPYKSRRHIMKDYEERNQSSVINLPPNLKEYDFVAKIDGGCLKLCCPEKKYMSISGQCIDNDTTVNYNNLNEVKMLLLEYYRYYYGIDCTTTVDPCFKEGFGRLRNVPIIHGRLHKSFHKSLLLSDFCLAIMSSDVFGDNSIYMIVCTDDGDTKYPVYLSVCLLVSLPFLLLTFIVYTVLPQFQNIHGYTLRAHVASLFVTYVSMFCGTRISRLQEDNMYCIITAYVYHFFFLSSFFWINVICFDIWWTFRKIRSCRTNITHAKNKFVIYSIYAWGVPLIFTAFCAIVDHGYIEIAEYWKPKICVNKFWFSTTQAKTIYFYVPMVTTIISNSFFFISTTVSIIHQNMRTSVHLRNLDKKSYNKNKHRSKIMEEIFSPL